MVSSYKVFNPSLVTALPQRHLALQISPTRTQVLLYLRLAGHGRRGLSVPLRWRPAHGIRSAVSLWPRPVRHTTRSVPATLAKPLASATQVRPFKLPSRSASRSFQISQRLKPQSSMPERFCISPFASAAQRVCHLLGSQGRCTSSRVSLLKQERVGSQQPPNPSFKRTCLRQAA